MLDQPTLPVAPEGPDARLEAVFLDVDAAEEDEAACRHGAAAIPILPRVDVLPLRRVGPLFPCPRQLGVEERPQRLRTSSQRAGELRHRLADGLLRGVELGRLEARMVVRHRLRAAVDAQGQGDAVRLWRPAFRSLIFAAAGKRPGLAPLHLAQRDEPLGLRHRVLAGHAFVARGLGPDLAGLILVEANLLPFERVPAVAALALDEGLSLVALLVGGLDGAAACDRRGAGPHRKAVRLELGLPLLGEVDGRAFTAGRERVFVDLVAAEQPDRPHREVGRAVRAHEGDVPAGELLVRQRSAGVPGLQVAEDVPKGLRVPDHRGQPVLRERLGCVVLRLHHEDGARVDVDEPPEDVLDDGRLQQLRAGHQGDGGHPRLRRRQHRAAGDLDPGGDEASSVRGFLAEAPELLCPLDHVEVSGRGHPLPPGPEQAPRVSRSRLQDRRARRGAV
ncbi:hypothetical protein CFIICLFH_1330 [Methylobacterium goesingense]|nr:hypothetical protein CFIICLFH_1330 [Methylobacterium goesingense]